MLLFLAGVKHLYIQQPVWTLTLLNVWTALITYSVSFQWVYYQPPPTLWSRGENNKTMRPAQSTTISKTGVCKVTKVRPKRNYSVHQLMHASNNLTPLSHKYPLCSTHGCVRRLWGWSVFMCGTYTLWRTHHPQWGSLEPKHSPQVVYCSQLSTGTLTT